MLPSSGAACRFVLSRILRPTGVRFLRGGRLIPFTKQSPAVTTSETSTEHIVRGPALSEYSLDDVWDEPTEVVKREVKQESEMESQRTTTASAAFPPKPPPVPGMRDYNPPPMEATDLLMERIKNCRSLEDLLDVVDRHDRIMNYNHLLRTVVMAINEIKAHGLPENRRQDFVRDPRFSQLCSRLIRSNRFMNPQATVEVLKLMSYLKIPSHARIVQTYLTLFRECINELSLDGLMFASAVVHRFNDNKLAAALETAIPIAFELRVEREMNVDDIQMFSRIFGFASNYRIKRTVLTNITNALDRKIAVDKTLRYKLSATDAAELFIRLERANCYRYNRGDFVFDILDRLKNWNLSDQTARALLKSVRYLIGKHPADFHPEHRIHELEKRLVDMVPEESDEFFDDPTLNLRTVKKPNDSEFLS